MKEFVNNNIKLLSIVTVNLNNSINLVKTLKSLEQMKRDPSVELIFIDGASSDDSIHIAKQFYNQDNITSEPDSGIYSAMNKGLWKSKGKYVLWLNSGDELVDDVHDIIIEKLKSSTATIVAFGTQVINENNERINVDGVEKKNSMPFDTPGHPSTFFNRARISEMNGYDESFKINADRELMLRIYFQGDDIQAYRTIISRFYMGGISSNNQRFFEDLRLNRKYKLIKIQHYIYMVLKYYTRRIISV
jgi:glycosyltransferase involved in cell wall biosynthesis